jgi:hypothetical protein
VQGVVFGHPQEAMQDFMDVATNTKGDWMFAQFHQEVQMRNDPEDDADELLRDRRHDP